MYAVFTSTEGTPLANFIYLGDKQGELWVWIRAHPSKLTSGYARFESVPQPSVTPFGEESTYSVIELHLFEHLPLLVTRGTKVRLEMNNGRLLE